MGPCRSILSRGIGLTALAGLAVAVALGRREAKEPARPEASDRRPWAAAPLVLSRYQVAMASPTRIFDPDTLREVPLVTSPDGRLDRAAVSPWNTGVGRFEVVGTWEEFQAGGEGGRILQGLELRRLSQPDGAVLGRAELRSILTGPPCWLPGPGARVLLAGLDGSLAFHDFDEEAVGPPTPLAWGPDCPPPYGGRFIAFDLARIGGEAHEDDGGIPLLAALQPRSQEVAPIERGIALWWLRVELPRGQGTRAKPRVVASGRVFPESRPSAGAEARAPVVVAGSEGHGRMLAYMTRPDQMSPWSLRTVSLRFGTTGRGPEAREDEARELLEGCLPVPPAAIADGSALVAVMPGPGGGRPVRVALVGPSEPRS